MRTFTFILLAILPGLLFSQANLIGYDFSDDPPTVLPTEWLNEEDSQNEIMTSATSEIQFKNGFENKAAQATGWENFEEGKYWMIYFTTLNVGDIKLSSRQQSGGEEPGPRDWKIQYALGEGGTWTDVPDSEYQVLNDWETGYFEELALPEECNNQEQVLVRWVVTSDTSSSGEITLENGKTKIDDILIKAYSSSSISEEIQSGKVHVWPNPTTSHLQIDVAFEGSNFQLVDIMGKVWMKGTVNSRGIINLNHVPSGFYILYVTEGSSIMTAKVQVKKNV